MFRQNRLYAGSSEFDNNGRFWQKKAVTPITNVDVHLTMTQSPARGDEDRWAD